MPPEEVTGEGLSERFHNLSDWNFQCEMKSAQADFLMIVHFTISMKAFRVSSGCKV